MKTLNLCLVLATVLVISNISLCSQENSKIWDEGFVITKTEDAVYKGDTLWGQIAKPMNFGNIFYKIVYKNGDGQMTKFPACDITAVKIGSDYFESIVIDDKSKFAIRIIDGPVSLYSEGIRSIRTDKAIEQQISSHKMKFDYHIKRKGSNKFVKVASSKFESRMSEFFSDNHDLSAQILDKKYNKKDIFEIVEKYNEWYNDHNN